MKLKNIIATAAIALTFTSCSDYLDRYPGDALSPKTFWNTESDAKLALVGCYNRLYSPFRPEERWLWETTTDNALCYHRNKDYRAIGDGSMASSGVNVHNYFTYGEIRTCNEYLANEGNIAWTSEELRQSYRSEVRMMRAMHLYFRVNLYGDFPFSEEVFSTVEEAYIPRTDKNILLDFIGKEMEESVSFLPDEAEAGRINRWAAEAFLTRYYLYRKDYQKAISHAEKVMNSGKYKMPSLSYEQSFLKANQYNSEVIMSFEHNLAGNFGMWIAEFLPNSYGGWSSVVPTQSLLEAYETKNGLTIDEDPDYDPKNPFVNRDPRLRASIIYPGQCWDIYANSGNYPHGFPSIEKGSGEYWSDADNATHTGMNFKKFYSDLSEYDNIWSCERNFPIFRYAEVLLSYAEAKIELGEIDANVYDAINQVRRRAGMPDVDATKYDRQDSLRELVRRERRVEFAYEGLRRDDIIRWGIAPEVMNSTVYHMDGIITDNKNSEGDYDVELQPYTDVEDVRKFTAGKNELLPVPQSVIDANPATTQNPQY